MVDHLQRAAERVVGGPKLLALAMHVQHVAADRAGGIAAVVHQFGPVGIAALDSVAAEGLQEIEAMHGRQSALVQHPAQGQRLGIDVALARQGGAHGFEQAELVVGRQRRMVRDVVGDAGEAVEGQDRRPVLGLQDEGRDREVLVLVPLAGAERGGLAHPLLSHWERK